mmetsp:Transcript_15504/g.38259  ORF Transcript_15504/g.38259 Transcript_15504/m.38259 type:complete len:129 (+) Transcript_15504:471-857(+)
MLRLRMATTLRCKQERKMKMELKMRLLNRLVAVEKSGSTTIRPTALDCVYNGIDIIDCRKYVNVIDDRRSIDLNAIEKNHPFSESHVGSMHCQSRGVRWHLIHIFRMIGTILLSKIKTSLHHRTSWHA